MYTSSLYIDSKVNIADVPVQVLIEEFEAWCSAACDDSNGLPEPELQVRSETFCGQCLCSRSKSPLSLAR